MPGATKVRSPAGIRQPQREAALAAMQQQVVPFVAAAHEHEELICDETKEITANSQQLGPFNIPAYGYARMIWIQVETTTEAETEAEATESEDLPGKIFERVELDDVNGTPLYNPMSGYTLMWTDILGGYKGVPDPRQLPYYSGTLKKPKFSLFIPVEISRKNAYGSIANQNSGAMYKLYLTLSPLSSLSTKFKKGPKIRIRCYAYDWSQPDEINLAGRPQAEGPPMLDSAQYHSHYIRETAKGQNTVLLTEVGDLIRFLLIIARKKNGERSDAVFPDPVELKWNNNVMHNFTRMMQEEHVFSAIPQLKERDKGVFAFLFNLGSHGRVGDDSPTLWYQTTQATRLEIVGGAEEEGSWDIVTNCVAPVAVDASERYEVPSRSSFQPEMMGSGQIATRTG